MSARDRRGVGGDLAGDFCFPSSSASRRRLLQRRREDGIGCTGVLSVGLVWLAVGRLDACSVPGSWSVAGGSCVSPRHRRRAKLDSMVEDELGVVPRPARHSDRWASLMLLLVVHKASTAMELLQSWVAWLLLLLLLVLVGAGVERWIGLGVAEGSKDLVLISSFLRGLSAFVYGLRVLLDRSVSVCTYFVLVLSLT